jgi:hypothetical protein
MAILNLKSMRTFVNALRPAPASAPDHQPEPHRPHVEPGAPDTFVPDAPDEQHSGGPSVEPEEPHDPEPEPTTPLLEHQAVATAVAGAAHVGSPLPVDPPPDDSFALPVCLPHVEGQYGWLSTHAWIPAGAGLRCQECDARFPSQRQSHLPSELN